MNTLFLASNDQTSNFKHSSTHRYYVYLNEEYFSDNVYIEWKNVEISWHIIVFQPHELEKNLFEKEVFNLFLIEALFLSIKIIKWLIHKQRIFICQTSKQHHQREDGKEKYYNSFCSLKIDPFLKQNFFQVVWHAYSWHILLHNV